jgi:hypothetical protein
MAKKPQSIDTAAGRQAQPFHRRRRMRMAVCLLLAVATSGLITACSTGPTQGSAVTIITQIDFTTEPFNGTFEVTEGADALGCSRGTFVDTPTDRGIHKKFTCDSGARRGTFTAEFFPPGGPWKIVNAVDDFSGLSGWGAFALTPSGQGDTAGVETLIGEIHI